MTVATPTASLADVKEPILVELDGAEWEGYLDSTERWLDNVLMLQSAFREMAEDVRGKIREPEFLSLLDDVIAAARKHEATAERLYGHIGRTPSRWRSTLGALTAKVRQGWADLIGVAGGATAPWRDLQQLLMSSANSISAFAAAEQLGYTLALPALADDCFKVTAEKQTHHLLIQEITLETVPWGILYKTGV
jgi:hypothetical protein